MRRARKSESQVGAALPYPATTTKVKKIAMTAMGKPMDSPIVHITFRVSLRLPENEARRVSDGRPRSALGVEHSRSCASPGRSAISTRMVLAVNPCQAASVMRAYFVVKLIAAKGSDGIKNWIRSSSNSHNAQWSCARGNVRRVLEAYRTVEAQGRRR